ncbi:MAG TPA: zf-HC2 domain-containing protein [Ktedonobacterales bacterium]|nr:zf-HC2 domain-containing protein [Ktedonobacterales bacterium]
MDRDHGGVPLGTSLSSARDASEAAPARAWRSPLCPRIEPLLPAFHDKMLAGEQARLVADHVASCAWCQSRLTAYAHMDGALRSLPPPVPDAALREGLFTRIAGARAHPRSRILSPLQRQTRRGATPAAAAAAREVSQRGPRWPSALVPGMAALLALAFMTQPRSRPPYSGVGSAGSSTQQVVAVNSLRELPKFADRRAAYLARDGRLHISAADGGTIVGPVLPMASELVESDSTRPYYDAAASPDGHYLAYTEYAGGAMNVGVPVALINLFDGTTRDVRVHVQDLFWSPDSSRIAANVDAASSPQVTLIAARDGAVSSLNASEHGTPVGIARIIGWINATHLGVLFDGPIVRAPGSSSNPLNASTLSGGTTMLLFGSLDLATGDVRRITAVPQPADIVLTPDGQEALILSSFWNSTAEVVSLADATLREVPLITSAFAPLLQHVDNVSFAQGGNWSIHLTWQPGAHVLAISLSASDGRPDESGFLAHQQTGVWLVDLDHDRASALIPSAYPLAWLPDGATLLICDPPSTKSFPLAGAGVGTMLYALTPVGPGGTRKTLATDLAVFLGLVRTK